MEDRREALQVRAEGEQVEDSPAQEVLRTACEEEQVRLECSRHTLWCSGKPI